MKLKIKKKIGRSEKYEKELELDSKDEFVELQKAVEKRKKK